MVAPPGTVEAAKCYLGLPRKAGITAFLAPAHKGTARVDVPSYLHRYCCQYLGPEHSHPTVNLLRKWFHTALHDMTVDKTKLHKLFTAIDAHSADIAQRHYILKGPEDIGEQGPDQSPPDSLTCAAKLSVCMGCHRGAKRKTVLTRPSPHIALCMVAPPPPRTMPSSPS